MQSGCPKLLKCVVWFATSFAALNWGLESFGLGWSAWGIGAAVPYLNTLVAYGMGAAGLVSLLWWVQYSVMGKSCD